MARILLSRLTKCVLIVVRIITLLIIVFKNMVSHQVIGSKMTKLFVARIKGGLVSIGLMVMTVILGALG
jgi:hypothetical protein